METTMRTSYSDKSYGEKFVPFDTNEVSRRLRKTNFNLNDGHGHWDDYKTIATVSFGGSKFDKGKLLI